MFRHKIALNPTTWIPASKLIDDIETVESISDGTSLDIAHPLGHRGTLRIAIKDDVLEFTGIITEPVGWEFSLKQPHPEWHNQEHVGIILDPSHDHTSRRLIAVLRNGEVQLDDTWYLQGEEVTDLQTRPLGTPELKPDVKVVVNPSGNGWRFRCRISIKELGSDYPASPIGLQLRLGIIGPIIHEAPYWPEKQAFWKDGPFAFGDIISPEPKLVISKVDFGTPVWKTAHRSSEISISGKLSDDSIRTGSCIIDVTDTLGETKSNTVEWSSDNADFQTALPVDYPFESKWSPPLEQIARVRIRINDKDGTQLWSASYPFGFDAGVIVREPFGMAALSDGSLTRPKADDPEFVDNFRAWLLSKLPDWKWTTTRDGSPSDFYLKADNPDHDINLQNATVFEDLAKLVRSLFDDWQDGLCAASMLLHHPCMTVHSSSWAKLATNSHTETVLRLGGCFCGDCARISARLADELAKVYDVAIHGRILGLRGHLTGLVETPIGDVLIDPMLGTYYHTLDNSRLATLDEMREDIRIQQRMWSLAYNHGHEFFYKIYNQTKQMWMDGPLVFPPEYDSE